MAVPPGPAFRHVSLEDDGTLVDRLRACVAAQKAAAERALAASYSPDPDALDRVSPQALAERLSTEGDVSDIRTDAGLSNCFVFHAGGLSGSVLDRRVIRRREKVDRLIGECFRSLLPVGAGRALACSGHMWYPPGSCMGWHTNSRVPGWRLYVTYAEEPGRSFFRYRDPFSGEIVTSWDRGWDVRLFETDPARPLWHAVYSDTNRFSFGYRLLDGPIPSPGLKRRLGRRIRRLGPTWGR